MTKFTDEEIREEVLKTTANPQLRRCIQCAHYNEEVARCEQLNIPTPRYQYCGHCKFFITNEEKMIQEAKIALAKKDREYRKDDRILTMSFISVEMSMVYLEHFEARIEAEYNAAMERVAAKYKSISERRTEEDQITKERINGDVLRGLIDSGYRGSVKVILNIIQMGCGYNDEYYHVLKKGTRIAQMQIVEVPQIELVEAEELSEGDRGENGIGSTGVGYE